MPPEPFPPERPPKPPLPRPGCLLLHWLPHDGRSPDELFPSDPPSPSDPSDPVGRRGCHGWSGRSAGGAANGLSSWGFPAEPETGADPEGESGEDGPWREESEEDGPWGEESEEEGPGDEEPGEGESGEEDWRSRISGADRSGRGRRKAVRRRRSGMW